MHVSFLYRLPIDYGLLCFHLGFVLCGVSLCAVALCHCLSISKIQLEQECSLLSRIGLSTIFAREWFLFSVRPEMTVEVIRFVKILGTIRTSFAIFEAVGRSRGSSVRHHFIESGESLVASE